MDRLYWAPSFTREARNQHTRWRPVPNEQHAKAYGRYAEQQTLGQLHTVETHVLDMKYDWYNNQMHYEGIAHFMLSQV